MKGLNAINFNAFDKEHKLRSLMMKCFRFLPDTQYLKFVYKMRTGKKLNLKDPVTFCDKLNWLKLHDRCERYTQLVDKLAVREVIKEKLGDGHVFPLLGSWDRFEDIDFDVLPNAFVLKCNHDSGSYRIIRDKNELTSEQIQKLKKHFNSCVRSNPFYAGREYPYKNVKAKIFAEKFMESKDGKGIKDYKFFCFHGEPKFLCIVSNRLVSEEKTTDYFDIDFNHLDMKDPDPMSKFSIEKPKYFEKMVETVRQLVDSTMKMVRVDIYEIDGVIYFGEYTFFHCGGFWPMQPEEWEYKLGSWINLDSPKIVRKK